MARSRSPHRAGSTAQQEAGIHVFSEDTTWRELHSYYSASRRQGAAAGASPPGPSEAAPADVATLPQLLAALAELAAAEEAGALASLCTLAAVQRLAASFLPALRRLLDVYAHPHLPRPLAAADGSDKEPAAVKAVYWLRVVLAWEGPSALPVPCRATVLLACVQAGLPQALVRLLPAATYAQAVTTCKGCAVALYTMTCVPSEECWADAGSDGMWQLCDQLGRDGTTVACLFQCMLQEEQRLGTLREGPQLTALAHMSLTVRHIFQAPLVLTGTPRKDVRMEVGDAAERAMICYDAETLVLAASPDIAVRLFALVFRYVLDCKMTSQMVRGALADIVKKASAKLAQPGPGVWTPKGPGTPAASEKLARARGASSSPGSSAPSGDSGFSPPRAQGVPASAAGMLERHAATASDCERSKSVSSQSPGSAGPPLEPSSAFCSQQAAAAPEQPSEAAAGAAEGSAASAVCAGCGASTTRLKRCAGCRVALYCSAACQNDHWRQHKADCLRASAAGCVAAGAYMLKLGGCVQPC